jgi:Pectinesterase
MKVRLGMAAASLALLGGVFAAPAPAAAKAKDVFTVCKHGCRYHTIQSAVNHVEKGKGAVVRVKPGTYHEGVQVHGHKYDGLLIQGASKNPRKTVLDGDNARIKGQAAQNGVDGLNVDNLKVKRLWARDYPSNGIFIHADPGNHCHGFVMDRDLASFNHSYGLFAKHCTGGRITHSKGWGHGDSAIYIGETPPQKNADWTEIAHDKAYLNVLGYSGTNSKYVDIHDSMFFNNGAGVVPNTLDSERFQPTASGRIRDNDIFWNNFNYFLPKSPVETVSGGLGQIGDRTINYPTGVGVALFGSDRWIVRDNRIFGNFFWGAASFSDPFNEVAVNQNNRFIHNQMGRGGTDTNRFDFFNDGSGSGNCFAGNSSSTFDVTPDAHHSQAFLYPGCPPPASAGTGTNQGDGASNLSGQVGELASYVLSDPPCSQQDEWVRHSHLRFKGITPIDTKDLGQCK